MSHNVEHAKKQQLSEWRRKWRSLIKGKIFASTEQYVSTYVWNSGQQFFVNTINFNLFNSLKTNSG